MNAKGTDLQNWKIEWEVCKTNNTQLCAENMWNDFIDNQWTEIIAWLKETNSDYIVFKNPNTIEQAIATTD
jgi:septum formation inhibitor-activating ATPase MinD